MRAATNLFPTIGSIVLLTATTMSHAEMGRTAGSWGVSPSGAATYTIPIWVPPGPKGIQPPLALTYNSQSGNGTVGIGWSLSGFSSIERCPSTVAEDGLDRAVNVDAQDRFCLSGNKLRITSGALSGYGTAGAVYQTQIANFARITSVGSAGTGPESFLVHSKDGVIYEYGNTADSRVILSGSTVFRWLLNKVSDRDDNSYVITYSTDNTVGRVPLSVQWAPTSAGASTYQYEATFVYSNKTFEKDIINARQGSVAIPTKQRLDAVEIGYSASGSTYATKRQYRLAYETSPTTSQSRLTEVKECAASTSTCLEPTAIIYQNGAPGVSSTASTGLASSSGALAGKYDFNGDGRSDLAYFNGSTWRVAFSNGSGFGTGVDTGITGTPLQGRFLATHQDGFLVDVSGTWRYVGYNGVSFTTTSTGTLVTTGALLSDFNGDGLADFVWKTISGSTGNVMVQMNTTSGSATVPSFGAAGTALTANLGPNSGNISFVDATRCPLERQCDINGDGRADLTVVVTTTLTCGGGPGGCTPTNTGYDLVTSGSGYVLRNALVNSFNPYLGLRFNDDRCMDSIKLGTTTLRVADCGSGTVTNITIPAQPQLVMDWDGDGNTDLLVNNGGTFGVYRSRGSTASPFDAVTPTTVPFSSNCSYFVLDVDGDNLDELACALSIAPFTVSYYTHSGGGSAGIGGTDVFATQIPDLAISITDGYDIAVSPAYVSTAQRNYTKGTGTTLPLVDATDPMIVVGKLTVSDGIGGAYDVDYTYEGARRHGKLDASATPGELSATDAVFGPDGQWAGFEKVTVVDSRNSLMQRTSYEQLFPRAGMLKTTESLQSNHSSLISSATNTNDTHVLDATANNQRYFNYVSESSIDRYEVGGALNGQLITNTLTTFTYTDFTYGNLTGHTTVVTDKDAMTFPSYFNSTWTTAITNTYASADVTNWCIGLMSETLAVYSSTAPDATSVTRTTGFTPDSVNSTKCRIGVRTTEPASTKYKVVESYGFDSFGNVDSISVVGRQPLGGGAFADMPTRTTSISWGTTGQFPHTVTDASGAVSTFTYNFDSSTLHKATDPNSTGSNIIETSFLYDPFNRKIRVTQPDGTYTTWAYQDCSSSGCVSGTHKITVVETAFDNLNAVLSDRFSYLDAYERPLVTRSRLLDGSYQWSEVQYDALGRVFNQYMPCSTVSATISCRNHAITFMFDANNRVTHSLRPRSAADVTPQTTTYTYAGRTQSVTDALNKTNSRITNVNGTMRQTNDPNNYAMNFTYDAAGSLTSAIDSLSNTRLSGVAIEYGAQAFQVAATDSALGAWTSTYNSLGELVAWTDAKGQSFSATYDNLSRLLTRSEPDTTTTFVYGANSSNFNIGRLESMSSISGGQTYFESYVYDNRARLQNKTIVIPGDATYSYGYTYDPNKGWLDTLTYPNSTFNYGLKLQYSYQNGILQQVSDANAPASIFWTANATNAWGQTTQETLGNGIVTNRSFDAVTAWLSAVQSGPSSNPAAVQNASYLYDLVGNVTQRQNNNLGFTETFFYGSGTDNLYRLSSSTLNTGAGPTTNLELTYDASGNILTKDEPGLADALIPQSVTWTSYNYPSEITAGNETANFSYGPNRQRWKMSFTSGSSAETTYYIGGLMEKVVVGTASTYRHTIVGGSGPVAFYSRTSGGTNTLRYVLGDHQGSIDAIADSTGATLVNESFTAFGERRDAADWSGPPNNRPTLDGVTRQGYTFQTVLGSMGLNHMNGRVQDAVSGRFLSADPYITEPSFTQNYNRYSYVHNNPLTYIDPSGFDDVRVDCHVESTPGGTIAALNGSFVYPREIKVVCVVTPNHGGGGGGSGGGGRGQDRGGGGSGGGGGGAGSSGNEGNDESGSWTRCEDGTPYDPPVEPVCPECYLIGGGRLLYAGLGKLIPGIASTAEANVMAQAAYANSARNSLKDLFRGPLAPVLSGVRQPTLEQSLARHAGDPYAVIEAASRTNKAVNAAGATGVALGISGDIRSSDDPGCGGRRT